MSVLRFLLRHAVVVWLTTAVLIGLGVVSALSMASGIYPEVEFPRIVVVAKTGGAPPDVYLATVTRPLEQALATVLGVQRIRSKTIRGTTEIDLQFAPDTDMWRALQLTESSVAEVRGSLPSDTELIVDRVTTGSFPVLTFNLSGPVDPRELREIADYVVRPALAGVPGVGRIEVLGGDVREIAVILDPEATASLHLSPGRVAASLRTAMGLSAVGRIDRDRQRVTVLADAQPKTLEEMRELPVAVNAGGVAVPVRKVAEVEESFEDRTVRIGGPKGEAVSLSVARIPGASTPDVVARAIEAVRAIGPSLPPGVTVDPVYDQANLVGESMAGVRDAILLGIALCAGVIALFLRDIKAGAMAASSVPVTLGITFLAMRLSGQTLNLMSLGGMAVAIGLVVDDAIVIVEAIARHRDLGASPQDAALAGTAELAPAVIGTTMTTVVVFLPLGFLQGVVGDFFRALAFTLTAAVLISLLVALVLVPLSASRWLPPSKHSQARGQARRYDGIVRWLVGHPVVAVALVAATIGAGVVMAPHVSQGFLPTMDEGAFVLDYFLPAGTSLATTDQYAKQVEQELRATPEVVSFTRRTGAELGPAAATQLNRGDIMVRLSPRSSRKRTADDVIADVRERMQAKHPEVRVEFVQVLQDVLADLAGNPRPIEVKLFGPDYARLQDGADLLAAKLAEVPGLVDLYAGHERDVPNLRFAMKRDQIARIGATPDDVAAELDAALQGVIVGQVPKLDRLIDVRVRYPNPVRFDPARVLDLPFLARGKVTTIGAVTAPEFTTSPAELLHEALQPMVDVTGDHQDRDLGSVAQDVERIVAQTKLPEGCRAEVSGQIESQRQTLRQLLLVGLVAAVLVLTVLAAQFRRLSLAALVLVSVPVALVGALAALLLTGVPLNASSLMGCVLLIGLVVKNGVLLLEEAEKRFDAGASPVEAVIEASDRRVRPVLMTTLATLAGLAPLALGMGAGAELQRPLAVAVMGGLATSMLATLALLPPLATGLLKLKQKSPG